MILSNEGLAEIIAYEAIILTPYIDAVGVKTVGIGSTISDIPDLPSWPWDRTITIEQAVSMFKQHVVKYQDAVNKVLTAQINQQQFDALVSITYNIGVSGMRNSTFMRLVNSGAAPASVRRAMKQWNKGGGRVITGLVNRRAKEAALYETCVYSSKGKALLVPTNSAHKPVYHLGKEINILDYL